MTNSWARAIRAPFLLGAAKPQTPKSLPLGKCQRKSWNSPSRKCCLCGNWLGQNQQQTRLGLEVGVTRWAETVVLCTLLFMAVGLSTNSFYLWSKSAKRPAKQPKKKDNPKRMANGQLWSLWLSRLLKNKKQLFLSTPRWEMVSVHTAMVYVAYNLNH